MFGYILPEKPELKIREYELFRAYYCGVCKSIGNRHGQIPRLTLNYDSTFLALLLSSMEEKSESINSERCVAHPLNRRSIVVDNSLLDYAADMNILLAYLKMKDDWNDEKSAKSVAGIVALGKSYKKLKVKYDKKSGIIEQRLQELSLLEKQKCDSVDRVADCFAKLMEEVTACDMLCDDEKTEKILRWIGYNIGKWIYVLDAYDDIEKDIRKNLYNPIINQYEYADETVDSFKARVKDRIEFNLVYSLGQISKGYELLNMKKNKGLMENIIYMGMLRRTEQILVMGSCDKVEKSV